MRNNAEQSWKLWKNSYWFNLPFFPTNTNGVDVFRPVWEWHTLSMKQSCEIVMLFWFPVDGATNLAEGTKAGLSSLSRERRNGWRVQQGEMKFKDVLRWRMEAPRGTCGRSFWHGSVDESEIVRPKEGRAGLRNVDYLENLRMEAWNQMEAGILASQFRVSGASGVFQTKQGKRVSAISGPYYTDLHAVTRWRHRFKGKGFDVWNRMFACLRELEGAAHQAEVQITQDGAFTFSQIWYHLTGGLFEVANVYEKMKDYMKDADDDANNGEEPPRSRFGATGDSIRNLWDTEQQKIKRDLPELMGTAHPFQDRAGDEYIMSEDLQLFIDEANRVITLLGYSLTFDWSNCDAYDGQVKFQDYFFLPDVVELSL